MGTQGPKTHTFERGSQRRISKKSSESISLLVCCTPQPIQVNVPLPMNRLAPVEFPGKRQNSPIRLTESFQNSPRRNQLHDAGTRIMPRKSRPTIRLLCFQQQHADWPWKTAELVQSAQSPDTEPINTMLKAFSSYATDLDEAFYGQLVPYFKQVVIPGGHVLFSQDEESDGLYLIQHGVMRAIYRFKVDHAHPVEESMVSGTLAGELSALSKTPRNATVTAERECVLWKLSLDELDRLEREQPDTARAFIKLILKGTHRSSVAY